MAGTPPVNPSRGELRVPAVGANLTSAANRHERRRAPKLGDNADRAAERNQAAPGIGHNRPPEPLEEFVENGPPHIPRQDSRARLKPALISIDEAADYLNIARSTFYKDFLTAVETVRIGKRRLVVMESLDALVNQLRADQ